MRAVLDSSCAIALVAADLLPQLSLLYTEILIPMAVLRELAVQEERLPLLQSLQAGGIFKHCKNYDQASAEPLLKPDRRRRLKDMGEAEAVVQASQYQAAVLVDDYDARKLVASHGLPCRGSLGVVMLLHEALFLDGASCRAALLRMMQAECRLPLPLVNNFLDKIGQPPLP